MNLDLRIVTMYNWPACIQEWSLGGDAGPEAATAVEYEYVYIPRSRDSLRIIKQRQE